MAFTRISHICTVLWLLLFCIPPAVKGLTLPNARRQGAMTPLKAGLGWGGGGNISQFEGHEVSWYFTWSPQSWVVPPPDQLEFVPQLWGQRDAQLFSSIINATSIAANGWKNVLGMNEPELPAQANMTAQEGVNLWKSHLEPLKSTGVRLGSAATTSGPSGKAWMKEFLALCAGSCTVDFIALRKWIALFLYSIIGLSHLLDWYGNVASEFIAYLEDFHNTFRRPIWVTEYSCHNFVNHAQCNYEEIVQFLNITQTYMDQTAWVERYAWFGAMASLPDNVNNLTALMDPSGTINDLGRQYIGSPVTQPNPTSISSAIPTSTMITTSSLLTSDTPTATPSTGTSSASSRASTTTSFTASPATTTPPYVIINGSVTKRLDYLSIFMFIPMLAWLLCPHTYLA